MSETGMPATVVPLRLPRFGHSSKPEPGAPPRSVSRYPGQFMVEIARNPLAMMLSMQREHGDIAHWRMGPQNIYLFSHPDLIRDVLVTNQKNFHKSRGLERARRLLGNGLLTSEGEFHLRQRRLVQPAFHRQRIAAYAVTMSDYAERTSARWSDGQSVDIHSEMMRLTLGIVARTLFDADVDAEAAEIGSALTDAFESFNLAMLPFTELLEKFPFPAVRKFNAARDTLDRIIYRMIEERRKSGEDRGDLLSMLLLATDTEGDGSGMSDLQLRDEALTLFLAGHETTANALTWTWYLLSQHPDVERRLHEEVDRVLGDRAPAYEDIPSLKYTRMVLAESMRLYPPAWAIGRRALESFEANGFLIPKRSVVIMSQYIVHRDPRFFPEPERFDPERWTPEAQASRPKYSYFPFGGGTRICIGEQFAWMEGILLVAALSRKWRMQLDPERPVEILPRITLRPKQGMRMRLQRRETGTVTARQYLSGKPITEAVQVKAKDLMTRAPCTCSPENSVQDVAQMMRDHDCGSVPVVEAGRVVGIITDRDLAVRGLAEGKTGSAVVRDLMTAAPQCCSEDDDVKNVERVMSDRQVRRVPIVNADGGCVGIISQADLARAAHEGLSDHEVAATLENISQPDHDPGRAQQELRARL